MVQIHNVSVSLALSGERARLDEALAADSGEGNGSPLDIPPYQNVPTVRLPSAESIAKALKEGRDREVASAKHESAVAGMTGTSGGTVGASPFAVLRDPLAARSLNPQPLPPRGALALLAELEGGATPPVKIPGDLGKEVEKTSRQKWLDKLVANPSEIDDRLAAAGLNPQPLPPKDSPNAIDEPSLLGHVRNKPHLPS